MSHVHYRFSSMLSSDVITFNGPSIALGELKHRIMASKRLKAANSSLQILNAQTNEEYTDANALILKNSSVIVRRVPAGAGSAASRAEAKCQKNPVKGTPKAIADPSVPLAQLVESPSLAETNVPEEEKIKVMMMQSCSYYDPSHYLKAPLGSVPPSNTCFKGGPRGHCKKKCPNTGNKTMEGVPRIKRSSGIPTSFMVEVKDPSEKGTMITPKGKYAIPIINVEAYARKKKEKPPALQEEPTSSSSSSSPAPVPNELLSLICRDIKPEAAGIPCCGRSYCDDCVRRARLDSEGHTSPAGHQRGVPAASSNPNQPPGRAVNDLQSGKPTWELKVHSRPRFPAVRDEPVKADSVIFKPKARAGKRRRRAKRERQFHQTSSSFPRQSGTDHEKCPRMEPPVKEAKKE